MNKKSAITATHVRQKTAKKKRVDETALEVMREMERKHIWYGDPDLICEISERAGNKQGHPLNRSAGVMRAIARSPLFELMGELTHLGRRYRMYKAISVGRAQRGPSALPLSESPIPSLSEPKELEEE